MARVCAGCRAAQTAWYDSRPSQVIPRFAIAAGATYDDTAAGVADSRRARHQQWAALVREQVAGIAAACRTAGHTTQAAPS